MVYNSGLHITMSTFGLFAAPCCNSRTLKDLSGGKGAELPKDCRRARQGRSKFEGKYGVFIGF